MSDSPPPAYPGHPPPHLGQPLPQPAQPLPQVDQPPLPEVSHPPHPAGQSSQMIAVPQPCQAVVLNRAGSDESKRRRQERSAKAFKTIGALQIAFGAVEVLLGILAIIIQGWFSYFATPIWVALLFFIATGILCISSAQKKKARVANLIMSILTALVAFGLFFLCVFMAANESSKRYQGLAIHQEDGKLSLLHVYSYTNICNPGTSRQIVYNCEQSRTGRKLVDSLIGLTALIEVVLAITSASYCCNAMCNMKNISRAITTAYYTTSGTVVYQGNQTPGQMYVQVPPTMMADGATMTGTNQGVPMYVVQDGYSMVPKHQYALPGAVQQDGQPQGYNAAFPVAQTACAPPYTERPTDTEAPLPE